MKAANPKGGHGHEDAAGMGDKDKLHELLTRRGFLGWAGTGAIVVGLGGLARFLARDDHFIRPPGALREQEFLSLCIRCDECREACPYRYITAVSFAESLTSAGTPRLEWPCRTCMACRRACPTGALRY